MSTERTPEFAVGDVVKLVSGGPDMSIKAALKRLSDKTFDGHYETQWFAGKKLESGKFPEESLELVKGGNKSAT